MYQAKLYSKYNGPQRNDVEYLLDNYLNLVKWQGNDIILDAGCGSGDVTIELLLPRLPKDFKMLLGVDMSDEMVRFANEHHKCDPRIDHQRLNIASKDILEDMHGKFHHIFSFFCFHWIQDQGQAMKNMYQMLKPGGDILLTFIASHPLYNMHKKLANSSKWKDYMKDINKYLGPYIKYTEPAKELEKVLKQAGFQISVCKTVESNFEYPNKDYFRNSITVINPFYSAIPINLREEFIDAYDEEVKMRNFEKTDVNGETSVEMPYEVFIVHAVKEDNIC